MKSGRRRADVTVEKHNGALALVGSRASGKGGPRSSTGTPREGPEGRPQGGPARPASRARGTEPSTGPARAATPRSRKARRVGAGRGARRRGTRPARASPPTCGRCTWGRAPASTGTRCEFFRRTYITEGLRHLLVGALKRLSFGARDPVSELQTNFGGGKTHSLLAQTCALRSRSTLDAH